MGAVGRPAQESSAKLSGTSGKNIISSRQYFM